MRKPIGINLGEITPQQFRTYLEEEIGDDLDTLKSLLEAFYEIWTRATALSGIAMSYGMSKDPTFVAELAHKMIKERVECIQPEVPTTLQ